MAEIIAGILALLAGGFTLIAAIGVLRFPDALSRMHAAAKVGAFAGSLALLACAFGFAETGMSVKALVSIAFLLLTAPIAAHLLGRSAAWRSGADRSGKAPDAGSADDLS